MSTEGDAGAVGRATRKPHAFLLGAVGLFALAALLSAAKQAGWLAVPGGALAGLRWLAVAVLAAHAFVRRSLTWWIVVGMVVGAELGHDAPAFAANLRILGLIFLRMIRTIIAPLLFATLVVGIAGHANLKQVGRMGIKAIVYFEVVTTLALIIGLAAINLSKVGVGVKLAPAGPAEKLEVTRQSASEVIQHIFPENIAKSVAEGQILQVVVFSLIFGIALGALREEKRKPVLKLCESLAEVMFKFTNIVMLFAPIGVAGAIAYTVSQTGVAVLMSLARLVGLFYAALAAFLLLVLLPVALLCRIPVRRFLSAVAEPASIAFATTSSEAALPRALEVMESFGVPRQIVAFVIPTGYSFNLDGSTLYLSLASIFVAQASGIHMTVGQQVVMMLTLMLTSKGVAGVSRAALVILLGTAASFGLPLEPVFILLGIDQLMDMGRTTVNVIGNCLATAVIGRWEGQLGSATTAPAAAQAE
jgi:proton glutamate symport protein